MKFKLFVLAIATLAMTSCGGSSTKEEPVLIKPTQTEIKGDLKDCFSVVDKSYQVKWDGGEKVITIEILRTDAELPFDRDNFDVYANKGENPKEKVAGFGIELIDSLGTVVKTITPNESSLYKEAMIAALRLLPGETGTVTWGTFDNWDWSITSFRLISSVENNTKEQGDIFDRAFEKWEKEDDSDSKSEKDSEEDDIDEDIKDMKKAVDVAKDVLEAEKALLDLL